MEAEEVKRNIGKKVLIVLKNNFRYTVRIPDFSGNTFSVIDKYGNKVTLDCEMISLISELGSDGSGR